jgi:competence protein ComEA
MQDTNKSCLPLRGRVLRRAITLAALSVFVAVVAITLTSPATAEAQGAVAPVDKVAAGKKSAPRADKNTPRTVAKNGKVILGVLNINTATEDQLQLLPGIGPTKAERVVEFRAKRGKFKRVKDLRRVKGFGYKTVKRLAPHLTVKGPTTLRVLSGKE